MRLYMLGCLLLFKRWQITVKDFADEAVLEIIVDYFTR